MTLPRKPVRSHEDYTVDILERIRLLLSDTMVRGDGEFSYTWRFGHEELHVRSSQEGSLHYAGSYHPNDGMCETGTGSETGICNWCGRTLM